jgi:glycerol dehydrogenase
MRTLPDWVARHGQSPLIVMDAGIAPQVQERLAPQFRALPAGARILRFSGDVTREAIDNLSQVRADSPADLVVGMGGGKTLDVAKGVAARLGVPFIAVPTIASTDAPASRSWVVYNADRSWGAVEALPLNPICVLVDTQWIIEAPRRFLVAGIGDAISKKFEVEACQASGGVNRHGTPATHTALVLARACYQTLRQNAVEAMACFDRGQPNEAFEATVEACLLMSALAFENGGLSIAHGITVGFPTCRGLSECLHGQHVAYGTLVQMALQHESRASIRDLLAFYRQVGLPTSLSAMGMAAPTSAEVDALADACFTAPRPRNHRDASSPRALANAIRFVETLAGEATLAAPTSSTRSAP